MSHWSHCFGVLGKQQGATKLLLAIYMHCLD